VLDGFLLTASPDHLSLRLPSAQARLIPADEIRSIYLARRRPVRELLPVTLVILGATAGLVGLARFPILESWFSRSAMWLAILGFALSLEAAVRTAATVSRKRTHPPPAAPTASPPLPGPGSR